MQIPEKRPHHCHCTGVSVNIFSGGPLRPPGDSELIGRFGGERGGAGRGGGNFGPRGDNKRFHGFVAKSLGNYRRPNKISWKILTQNVYIVFSLNSGVDLAREEATHTLIYLTFILFIKDF